MTAVMIKSVRPARAPRTVQVGFYCDPQRRDAETLLGAWPTLPNVAAAVARAGAQVTVVQAAAACQTLTREGVTYRFVDDARGMAARLLGTVPVVRPPARLIAEVAAQQPDLIHVHGLAFPAAVWQLRRAMPRVPLLVQDHASRPPEGLRRAVWRAAYRALDGLAFTTRAQVDGFVDAGAIPPTIPVYEVMEGSSTFTPGDQTQARLATGLRGDPCVLWTAHLDANKDPLMALEAFRRAATQLRDARLWCCFGKAPMRAAVERAIAASRVLRERVTLLGARPHAEMEGYFRAADLFLQASLREGCSYSIVEAMSCGTALVVTDIPSSRQLVGKAGSLTPVGDATALARGLVAQATRDPVARRREVRERFEQALSFDRIGTDLCDAYDDILARR